MSLKWCIWMWWLLPLGSLCSGIQFLKLKTYFLRSLHFGAGLWCFYLLFARHSFQWGNRILVRGSPRTLAWQRISHLRFDGSFSQGSIFSYGNFAHLLVLPLFSTTLQVDPISTAKVLTNSPLTHVFVILPLQFQKILLLISDAMVMVRGKIM